jgi:hypothetical protein
MRHLGSLALSLLLTPIMWVLGGIGIVKFAESWQTNDVDYLAVAVGLAALLGAGTAYTLLVLPRLAPVGPALAGLVLLGSGVWAIVDRDSFVDIVPADLLGVETAGYQPAAFAPVVAVPLLCMLASPRRWRRRDEPAIGAPAYPMFPPRPPYQGPPAAAPISPGEQATTPIYTPPAAPPSWPPGPEETRRL